MANAGRRNLADRALAKLEELIITLKLKPGSVWLEAELCERVGIGRTPVRQALQRLKEEHLVEIIPRYGVRISEINVEDQILLLEVRRELERLVATCAARRASGAERAQCARMGDVLLSMSDAGIVEFLGYHYQIKRFTTEIARNPYAARMLLPLHAISRRFYYVHHLAVRDVSRAAKLHAATLRAIADGDIVQAANASDRQMDHAAEIAKSVVIDARKTASDVASAVSE